MKINNLLFAFSSAILLLGYGTDAIASLKKQFKERNACSYDTATFQGKDWISVEGKKNSTRFCVTSSNSVIQYSYMHSILTDKYFKSSGNTLKGKVGESEMWWNDFYNSFYLTEYEIDGDKLISYSCLTSNGIDCSGLYNEIVLGTKINNNSNNYSVKIEEGGRTYTLDNGDQYIGRVVNGKKQGQGTYIYKSGGKYVGGWLDDMQYGKGTLTYKDGAKYVGEWKDGQRHGLGTMTYKDGSEYVGDYLNGYPNGQGTLTYKNDSKYVGKYVGEFKDGSRHGQGTYTSAEGITYEGEWKDGEFRGK